MDMSQYMGMYIDGANENLQEMNTNLLDLEKEPQNLEIIGVIFRAAHTLKGMSATMGFARVADLTHEMENLMDLCRQESVPVTEDVIDCLFRIFDLLERLVKDTIEGEETVTEQEYDDGIADIKSVSGSTDTASDTAGDTITQVQTADAPPDKTVAVTPAATVVTTPATVVEAPASSSPVVAQATGVEIVAEPLSPVVAEIPPAVPAETPPVAPPADPREVVEDNVNREEMAQYMGMYVDGANEGLEEMNKLLLKLEQDQSDISIFDEIFRAAHTLKGMSATMGFNRIAYVTHEMENLMDLCRTEKLVVTSEIIDAIFSTFDVLETLVQESIDGESSELDFYSIVDTLKAVANLGAGAAGSAIPETPAVADGGASSAAEAAAKPAILALNEYESQVAIQAVRQDFNCFQVNVTLVDDCLLKSARVFMVVRALEELDCEIIKSEPPSHDLEEEKFEQDFSIVVITKADNPAVYEGVDTVSEIEKLEVINVTLESLGEKSEAPVPVPVVMAPAVSPEQAPAGGQTSASVSVPTPAAPPQKAPATPAKAGKKASPAKKSGSAKKSPTKKSTIPTTIRVDMRRLEELMNLVGELVTNKTRLNEVVQNERSRNKMVKGASDLKELSEVLERVNMITGSLQEVVLNVRMVPIETVFDRFPRLVRDLSKKLNKKIELVLEGKDTEMDRTVIDEIGDPMVHLIRNSIDHGIEDPDVRLAAGKVEKGTIVLNAHHEGNFVVIEIRDNGKGIDPDVVGNLAIERGLFTPEEIENMPVPDVQKIIFMAGFSTADVVSDLSGRGVGMDAVKAKIEELNGQLLLDSRLGEGTTVRVKLPMTLAILQALMINLKAETYAIPLSMVLETVDIFKEDINIVQHQEVYVLRGEVIPLIRLNDLLDVPEPNSDLVVVSSIGATDTSQGENGGDSSSGDDDKESDDSDDPDVRDILETDEISVVVCSTGEKKAGFIVDNLIGQQEIVIKPLGLILQGLTGMMGATIKGDGSVALILDIPSLMETQ